MIINNSMSREQLNNHRRLRGARGWVCVFVGEGEMDYKDRLKIQIDEEITQQWDEQKLIFGCSESSATSGLYGPKLKATISLRSIINNCIIILVDLRLSLMSNMVSVNKGSSGRCAIGHSYYTKDLLFQIHIEYYEIDN